MYKNLAGTDFKDTSTEPTISFVRWHLEEGTKDSHKEKAVRSS